MLAEDIAKLMAMIPLDEEVRRQNDADKIKVFDILIFYPIGKLTAFT